MPRLRLLAAGCLFVLWIGFLSFLVWDSRSMVVLSRPQFLAANLYVLAELSDSGNMTPGSTVTVRKVYWAKEQDAGLVGKEIVVQGLGKCESRNGWIGTGLYILPLTASPDGFRLTEIPISPGFHHHQETLNYLRIYPATEQAKDQVENLVKEWH